MKKGKLVRCRQLLLIMFQKEGGAMFRILVAEDDHEFAPLITTKLKQENYTIYTAENGEDTRLSWRSIRWIY